MKGDMNGDFGAMYGAMEVQCWPVGGATKGVGQLTTVKATVLNNSATIVNMKVGFTFYDQATGAVLAGPWWTPFYAHPGLGSSRVFETTPFNVDISWSGRTIRVRAEVQTDGGLTLTTSDCPALIIVPAYIAAEITQIAVV